MGSKWGNHNSTSFWSWRHFTYFFAQDCFFAWCGRPLRILAEPCSRMSSCDGWGAGSESEPFSPSRCTPLTERP